MTEPTLSELYAKLASLRARIERLQPPGEVEPPPPTDGMIIRAGTIFYCRPSKFREFTERLGGVKNVEIMDTLETEGFACGKHVDPKPWTNEVYPTDIGPSCRGIDSNTARIVTSPINNNITPTVWDPSKLFLSRSYVGSYPFYCTGNQIKRVLLIHNTNWSSSSRDYLIPHELFTWGRVLNPDGIMNSFPSGAFFETEETYVITTDKNNTWPGQGGIRMFYVKDYDTLCKAAQQTLNVYNTSFVLFGDYEPCLIKMSGIEESKTNDSMVLVKQVASSIPYKIPLFKIYSQTLEQVTPTPVLKYGGYSRTGHKFTGPTPRWNRTNILQIKTRRDIKINV